MTPTFRSILLLVSVFLAALVQGLGEIQQLSLSERATTSLAISSNFADPGIIKFNGTWYAFATHTRGTSIKIQVAKSPDFNTWSLIKKSDGTQYDALPKLPTWVNQTNYLTWAPSVHQLDDGTFVMYYSAVTTARPNGSKHCVGAATASNILGPYTAQTNSIICPLTKGGAIDASGFKDHNGKRYIVYKVDGNSIGHGGACGNTIPPIVGTPLMLQPVAADGYTFTGNAISLLDNSGTSDQGIIEAPQIIRSRTGTYFLFFSSGCFATSSYTVSYATASSITGPYTRASGALFKTGDGNGFTAPGGMSIWSDDRHMVFHANSKAGRSMYTAFISLDGTTVTAT